MRDPEVTVHPPIRVLARDPPARLSGRQIHGNRIAWPMPDYVQNQGE